MVRVYGGARTGGLGGGLSAANGLSLRRGAAAVVPGVPERLYPGWGAVGRYPSPRLSAGSGCTPDAVRRWVRVWRGWPLVCCLLPLVRTVLIRRENGTYSSRERYLFVVRTVLIACGAGHRSRTQLSPGCG